MTISAEFNAELALVNAARSFTYQSGHSDYGENEWSVAGWTVYGGSDDACEQGASEAMYQMGFRWYTPEKTVRPVSLPSGGVTLVRQQFQIPHFRLFYNYGYASWGTYKEDSFKKWVALNCADDRRLPNGHAWPSIISAIDTIDGFFTDNPTYMTGVMDHPGASFNLDLTGADYDALVDRVAAYVATDLNQHDRRNFDPQDGATWSSDEVCAFSNAVIAKVRETVPNATLGIYAYAGHRRAPSFDCPHIYVQVTLGFNDGGIGYSALVAEWAARVGRVGLRGYGLIAAQDEYSPFRGGICNDTAFENETISYSDFVTSGCDAMTMESTGHHIPALVGHYALFRRMRDGTTTHADVRDDLLANLPAFTAETKALFEYWATNKQDPFAVSRSYTLIDTLPDNSLSTEIKRYWTWYRNVVDRVEARKNTHGKDGVYYSRLEQSLRFCKALQDDGIVHGYTYARQEANSNVRTDRPDLLSGFTAHWSRHGQYPPDSLYDTLKAKHLAGLQRPSELDDTTLALCAVQPVYASTGTATDFITESNVSYAYIGPGTVTTQDGATVYTSGIHYFEAVGLVQFTGGLLFLNSFPTFYNDEEGHPGSRWLYIPKMVRGRVYLTSTVRLRIDNSAGNHIMQEHVPPFSANQYDPRQLEAGQSRISWGTSTGSITNINCNPWVSPQHDRALMPKALAVREGVTILAEY